ncbi:hypothetical protein [Variovorax sp. GB1P17]|uniref:hypothetical protein n=1 Tax=Variovorax sp. GB1P17 TaxID=3443740 RepID=UPI003F46F4A9
MSSLKLLFSLLASSCLTLACTSQLPAPRTTKPAEAKTAVVCDAKAADDCAQWLPGPKLPTPAFTFHTAATDSITTPIVDGRSIYFGVNLRWSIRGLRDDNPLLKCDATAAPPACETVKSFKPSEVPTIRFAQGNALVVERITYLSDSLNIGTSDFMRSSDAGKTWQPIPLPGGCGAKRNGCELAFASGTEYTVLHGQTAGSDGMPVDDEAVRNTTLSHTTDGGRTWTVVRDHIPGIRDYSVTAIADGKAWFTSKSRNGTTAALLTESLSAREQRAIDLSSKDIWVGAIGSDANSIYLLNRRTAYGSIHRVRAGEVEKIWETPDFTSEFCASNRRITAASWDSKVIVPAARAFRTFVHTSADQGKSWRVVAVPDALLNARIACADDAIYLVTDRQIFFFKL